MVNFEVVVCGKTERLEKGLKTIIDKYPHKVLSGGTVEIKNVETGSSVYKLYMRAPLKVYLEAKRTFGDECLVSLGHHV